MNDFLLGLLSGMIFGLMVGLWFKKVSLLTEKVQKLSDRKGELEEEVNRLRGERDKASWEATQLGIKVEDLEDKNNKLQNQITSFEENNNIYAYSFWDRFVSLLKRR